MDLPNMPAPEQHHQQPEQPHQEGAQDDSLPGRGCHQEEQIWEGDDWRGGRTEPDYDPGKSNL